MAEQSISFKNLRDLPHRNAIINKFNLITLNDHSKFPYDIYFIYPESFHCQEHHEEIIIDVINTGQKISSAGFNFRLDTIKKNIFIQCTLEIKVNQNAEGKKLKFFNGQNWKTFDSPLNLFYQKYEFQDQLNLSSKSPYRFSFINMEKGDQYIVKNPSFHILETSSRNLFIYLCRQSYNEDSKINKIKDTDRLNILTENFIKTQNYLFDHNLIIKSYNVYEIDFEKYHPTENDYFLCYTLDEIQEEKEVMKFLQYFPYENRILYSYECMFLPHYRWHFNLLEHFGKVFLGLDYLVDLKKYFWVPNYHQLFTQYYDIEISRAEFILSQSNPTKFLANNPINSWHGIKRINVIKEMSSLCPDEFDVYGSADLFKELKNYKGVINFKDNPYINKTQVLSQYRFVLVSENCFVNGYVTEKLIDSLSWGNVPVYYGSYEIKNFFPNLFENGIINGHDYETKELYQYLKSMPEQEYMIRVKRIKKYRNYYYQMFSLQNIWNYILAHSLKVPEFQYHNNLLQNVNQNLEKKKLIIMDNNLYLQQLTSLLKDHFQISILRQDQITSFGGDILILSEDKKMDKPNIHLMFSEKNILEKSITEILTENVKEEIKKINLLNVLHNRFIWK